MGKYQHFEELPVWQEAARLYQRVLDIVEEANVPLSATFRNQLERAALCVGNCVAEGFEAKTSELVALLGSARGASLEVQSMVAVISDRPKVARLREGLQQVRASAEACARQLGSFRYAIENPGVGKRQQVQEQGAPQPSAARGSASGGAASATGRRAGI